MRVLEVKGGPIMFENELDCEQEVQILEIEQELSLQQESENEEVEDDYKKLVQKYNGEHKKALFEYCFLHNIPFFENTWQLLKSNNLSY